MSGVPKYIMFCFFVVCGLFPGAVFSKNTDISIDKIMQDPKWMGHFPSGQFWSEDSKNLYFMWNNDGSEQDSLYVFSVGTGAIHKLNRAELDNMPPRGGSFNKKKTAMVYVKDGDLFLYNLKNKKSSRLTVTAESESSPVFFGEEDRFTYLSGGNLYLADIDKICIKQITDIKKESAAIPVELTSAQKWAGAQEHRLFKVFQDKSVKKSSKSSVEEARVVPERAKTIYSGESDVRNLKLSPDGRFVTFRLETLPKTDQRTFVPVYVNDTGYTSQIPARPKAGTWQTTYRLGIYDTIRDSLYYMEISSIPGIGDFEPLFIYPENKNNSLITERDVVIYGPYWSGDGKYPVVVVRTLDNKDKWIMLMDSVTGVCKTLSREHDEAWIGVPWWIELEETVSWMPDNRRIWFLSEESGFSHIYTIDAVTKEKKQITAGNFDVSDAFLSQDGRSWYFTSNEKDHGEMHFYRVYDNSGVKEMLTSMTGNNRVTLSPDEKKQAIVYSYTNKPWELYISDNRPGAKPRQITESRSAEFKSYKWRDPEIIEFTASDGVNVRARLYKPEKRVEKGPAVIFVHGAGYIQNAHRWWSNYYREYMFNNYLVDNGYTVMDIDYRGSSGYGHKYGTAIYRDMGGKDLSDQVDGAGYLVNNCGVAPDRIGLYGGSYGGFITLMAMFTKPGVFAAGAALRPVTDWAHYEHPYTASILNIPQTDSLSYIKSSPIYHAEGLTGALLICHGMGDTNVQFQDVARLSQRLIELGKDNWDVAFYPVENHGFTEPSSWRDEYNRIFRLFERELKKEPRNQ